MLNTSITKFLNERNHYITNLDPDGFFTYVLINKYIKGEIVGFTNSKDCVCLLDGMQHSASCVTYLDMFVTNPKVHSIDQHIVTRTPSETKALQEVGTKLNPNLLFNQDLTDYRHKFPLSTFFFCMLLLGEEYDVKIDWHRKVRDTDIEIGHLLLDIDGVLTNLRDYNANVKAWMDKLKVVCANKALIGEFYDYVNTIPLLELKAISDKVRGFQREVFHTETKDGGYKQLTDQNVHYIEAFLNFIAQEVFDVEETWEIKTNKMSKWYGERKLTEGKTFDVSQTFSYAIVKANDNNLSYTTRLKRHE